MICAGRRRGLWGHGFGSGGCIRVGVGVGSNVCDHRRARAVFGLERRVVGGVALCVGGEFGLAACGDIGRHFIVALGTGGEQAPRVPQYA